AALEAASDAFVMPAARDGLALEREVVASMPAPLETSPAPPDPVSSLPEMETSVEAAEPAALEAVSDAFGMPEARDGPTLEPEIVASVPAPLETAPTPDPVSSPPEMEPSAEVAEPVALDAASDAFGTPEAHDGPTFEPEIIASVPAPIDLTPTP